MSVTCRHNFGRYCKNGCGNYHIVNGDSACEVTGTRLTSTRMGFIVEVGCASYVPEKKQGCDEG